MIKDTLKRQIYFLEKIFRLTSYGRVLPLKQSNCRVEGDLELFPEKEVEYYHPSAEPRKVYSHQPARRIFSLRRVQVWPDTSLVLDKNDNIVAESALSQFRIKRFLKEKSGGSPRRKIAVAEPCAAIGQGSMENYYHFLIDILPRLFAFQHPELRRLSFIRLLIPDRFSEKREQLIRSLVPSNVSIERIRTDAVVSAAHYLHLPFLSNEWEGYLPSDYLDYFQKKAFDFIGSNGDTPPEKVRNIYVSRADADVRKVINDDEIVENLEPLGFERIVPGMLTFKEQIRMFSEGKVIVGMHGAGMTNIIFSKNAKVLEFFPTNYPGVNHYRLLSAALGHEYGNLFSGRIFRPDELQVPWKLKFEMKDHNANIRIAPENVLRGLQKLNDSRVL